MIYSHADRNLKIRNELMRCQLSKEPKAAFLSSITAGKLSKRLDVPISMMA